MKKSDDEIQTLSEKELKLIDNVVHLTSTTEEENIFHQGFYSGYKTCEKKTINNMKTKEEIKLMGEKYATTHEDVSDRLGKYLVSACFQDGYIQCQCQEDNSEKKYTEEDMRKAFKDGSWVTSWSDMGIEMKYDTFEQWFEQFKKK